MKSSPAMESPHTPMAMDSPHPLSRIGKPYLGSREVLLLISVGVIAGAISGLTLWASQTLSKAQVLLIDRSNSSIAPGGYFLSAIALAVVSAVIIKYFCKQAAGSGLPEFKSILAGEMKQSERVRLVSFRIFCAKVFGLVLATGSGLSIGTEGPLVHISACIAHLLMTHVTEFGDILDSPSLSKQIFAASAAVGISSAFNAPVGGLLFSVEITTTFYLISNYFKSFVAAMAGAFACSIFLITQENNGRSSGAAMEMTISTTPFLKWELFIFALIGFTFGYIAHLYLKLSQQVHLLMRPYCKGYPLMTCATVAGITALVIYFTGAYSADGLRVFALASDVLSDGHLAEMKNTSLHPLLALFISFIARSFITILGFNLPIPAGIFVPVFLIGSIVGRFVGTAIAMASSIEELYIPGYALVGGCAFASGVTQTISVAVVAVELTGNLYMLLPCLIASVIATGVSRSKGLSVYDQAMFNKGLQSLQLLLQESMHGFRYASDVMRSGDDIVCIPRKCSSLRLLHILDENSDSQFPVVDDLDSKKLLGTLSRVGIFESLRGTFHEWNMDDLLAMLLPEDDSEWGEKAVRLATKEENKRLRALVYNSFSMRLCGECLDPSEMSEMGVTGLYRRTNAANNKLNHKYDHKLDHKQGKPDKHENNHDNKHNNNHNNNHEDKPNFAYEIEDRHDAHVTKGCEQESRDIRNCKDVESEEDEDEERGCVNHAVDMRVMSAAHRFMLSSLSDENKTGDEGARGTCTEGVRGGARGTSDEGVNVERVGEVEVVVDGAMGMETTHMEGHISRYLPLPRVRLYDPYNTNTNSANNMKNISNATTNTNATNRATDTHNINNSNTNYTNHTNHTVNSSDQAYVSAQNASTSSTASSMLGTEDQHHPNPYPYHPHIPHVTNGPNGPYGHDGLSSLHNERDHTDKVHSTGYQTHADTQGDHHTDTHQGVHASSSLPFSSRPPLHPPLHPHISHPPLHPLKPPTPPISTSSSPFSSPFSSPLSSPVASPHADTRKRNVSWAARMDPTLGDKNQKSQIRNDRSFDKSNETGQDKGNDRHGTEWEDIFTRPRVMSFVEIAVSKVNHFLHELPEGVSPEVPMKEDSERGRGLSRMRAHSIEEELESYAIYRERSISRELNKLTGSSHGGSSNGSNGGIGRSSDKDDHNVLHANKVKETERERSFFMTSISREKKPENDFYSKKSNYDQWQGDNLKEVGDRSPPLGSQKGPKSPEKGPEKGSIDDIPPPERNEGGGLSNYKGEGDQVEGEKGDKGEAVKGEGGEGVKSERDEVRNAFKAALEEEIDLLRARGGKRGSSGDIRGVRRNSGDKGDTRGDVRGYASGISKGKGRPSSLTISAFPFSVTKSTSMEHIYVLFEMVKLLHIYVLEEGRLSGVISRGRLLERLKASQSAHSH